jgi:hypothetical protein
MKPGIYQNLDIDEYHSDSAAISNTGLRDFARSPFHYYSLHLDPSRPPSPERSGQLEGSLAHCATLEPDQFSKRYAVGPDVSRATKTWKSFYEGLQSGIIGVKPEQAATALAQAKSVRSLPDVAALLSNGQAEVSAYWTDEETGVLCRCRPDFVSPAGDGVVLLDVKTFASADRDEFARQVARKGYANQAAFYSEGYSKASGKPVLGFVFVASEMAYPHAAAAYMLPDEWLEMANRENHELLIRFALCQQRNQWPGYSLTIEALEMPRWLAIEAEHV